MSAFNHRENNLRRKGAAAYHAEAGFAQNNAPVKKSMGVPNRNRIALGVGATAFIILLQILLRIAGSLAADWIPYSRFDPYDAYAGVSIHHTVQILLALAVIGFLSMRFHLNFRFQRGDTKKGIRYLFLFVAGFTVLSFGLHLFMYLNDRLPVYAFPLDWRNVIGTLGFQLFLSGPCEEIVYRALPITVLTGAFGRPIPFKSAMTPEVILTALLFSLAHVTWSLSPFALQADPFQLAYAFAMGCVQGIVYQKTESIYYPMIMHSVSNVLMVGGGYAASALFL